MDYFDLNETVKSLNFSYNVFLPETLKNPSSFLCRFPSLRLTATEHLHLPFRDPGKDNQMQGFLKVVGSDK
jgi:hypothetical protein